MLAKLQRLWLIEATKYNVLPLDDRSAERLEPTTAGRPTLIRGNSQLFFAGMGRLSENSVVSIKNRSFSITAEVEVADGGVDGVIIAQGGRREQRQHDRACRDEHRLGIRDHRRRGGGRGGGDAVRASHRTRGQLLRGRRSRVGGLRGPGDGVLGAARVHRLSRLRELRPVAQRRRAGGARRRAAGRERAVLPTAGRRRADGRARLLRPLGRQRRVGPHARRHAGRLDQPVGGADVPHPEDGAAEDGGGAVGLRQVARPDLGARGGASRPRPRRGRRDPDHSSGSCSSSSRA